MKRIRAIAAALLMLGAASCGGDSDDATSAQELTRVRYYLGGLGTVPVPGSAPWFIGIEKGFFADAGIDMEMLPGESPSAGVGLLDSGRAEFVSMDFLSLALAREENPELDIQIVAVHHARAPYAVFSLTDGANITALEDLEGATVYQPTGTFTGTIVEAWARSQGISGIKLRDGDRDALPRLLISGKIPAVAGTVFSRPSMFAAAQEAGEEVAVLDVAEAGLDDFYGTGMAVSQNYANENPETVRAFVEAALRTFQWCFDNPEEAGAIMEDLYPTVPAPATVAAIEELEAVVTDHGSVDQIGVIDPAKVESTVALVEDVFDIDVDPQSLYTTEFLD
jgi:NitT/TauT family transport system substrate-binding protein